jgi:hypothetical protein
VYLLKPKPYAMEFNTLKNLLYNWKTIRNNESGLNLLNTISDFRITKEQYLSLPEITGTGDQTINLYIGVDLSSASTTPYAFLVRSECDIDTDIEAIYQQNPAQILALNLSNQATSEKHSEKYPIPKIESWERAFRWLMYKETWFNDNRSGSDGIVRAFSIPVEDFELAFSNNETEAFLFFGIKDFSSDKDSCVQKHNRQRSNNFNIEILICGQPNEASEPYSIQSNYSNLTRPCPPYDCNDFGLMKLVDQMPIT